MGIDSGPQWKDPNAFQLGMRCCTVEHAEALLELGRIKLNTPRSWVTYAEKYGEGRGDLLEGTIAACHIKDMAQIKKIIGKYGTTESALCTKLIGQTLYFKRNKSIDLPCFCIYVLKNSMFECPGEGKHHVSTEIPATYFKDFVDNRSKDKCLKLPRKDQPAIVVIRDFDKFKQRLLDKLTMVGVKADEIISGYIKYYDFSQFGKCGWVDFGVGSPFEVLVKDIRFKNQSEVRFIVNTKNKALSGYLAGRVIDIGSIKDIADIIYDYPYDGIRLEEDIEVVEQPN